MRETVVAASELTPQFTREIDSGGEVWSWHRTLEKIAVGVTNGSRDNAVEKPAL